MTQMEQRYFEDVSVGDEMPEVTEVTREVQLFLFSAATNNPHRIHYDLPYAQSEGHPTIVTHGPLQAGLMGKTLANWMGSRGRILRFAVQNRGSAYPHEELIFGGKILAMREEDGRGLVDLEIYERKTDGSVIMPGTATVSLPRRQ